MQKAISFADARKIAAASVMFSPVMSGSVGWLFIPFSLLAVHRGIVEFQALSILDKSTRHLQFSTQKKLRFSLQPKPDLQTYLALFGDNPQP
jgi:hypothetical protein